MPLYEYQCDACGHRFEVIRRFSDPPLDICPKCGSTVRKLIASPAFQFKGTGWYITDYAKKKESGAKDDKDSKEKGGSDSATGDKSTGEKSTGEQSGETTPASDKTGSAGKSESSSTATPAPKSGE